MNRQLRYQGRIDIPLNEEGHRQALQAAQSLGDISIDHMYTSPLQRAMQSAAPIASEHDMEPVPQDWLIEVNHGDLEGMSKDEAVQEHAELVDQWASAPHKADFPGGECLEDVRRRVAAGLCETYHRDNGVVVCVTHQVVSAVARCIAHGRPLSEIWIDKLPNGEFLHIPVTEQVARRLHECAAAPRGKGASR